MYKILTIVGTRPELIKMSRVIDIFDKYTEHVLVHTNQNHDYELNQIFFDEMKIRRPDYFLGVSTNHPMKTISNILERSYDLFKKIQPDAILIYGDTNSCLAAISAKKLKIPIFHMEAGNRCFDERVPEEINRKIIDHISDINITLTEHARNNLIHEGLSQNKIFNTGSHMPEVINFYKRKIDACSILKSMKLVKNKYFLISYHREENLDSDIRFKEFLSALKEIDKKYSMPIIISAHPRAKKKLDLVKLSSNIVLNRPFSFFEYIKLQQNAFCVISDSGTITEESCILGFPAITIREAHERPEGMDNGVLIMSDLTPNILISNIETIKKLSNNKVRVNSNSSINKHYEVVSAKILKIVNSYISFINRETWKKDVTIKSKKA